MLTEMQAEELNEVFRSNLHRRRKELGLTQTDLAGRINKKRGRKDPKVHAPYLSDLESGVKVPNISTLAELAEALETSPESLIAVEEKVPA